MKVPGIRHLCQKNKRHTTNQVKTPDMHLKVKQTSGTQRNFKILWTLEDSIFIFDGQKVRTFWETDAF